MHYVLEGCPTIVRADRGTENCNVASLQPFLRENASDSFRGEKSFMYGKSTSNQVTTKYFALKYTCFNK